MIDATPRRFTFESPTASTLSGRLMKSSTFVETFWTSRFLHPHQPDSPVEEAIADEETVILDPTRMRVGLGYPFRLLDHTFLVMKRTDATLDVFYMRDVPGEDESRPTWTPAT